MLTLLLYRDQSAGTDEILHRIAADVAQEKPNRILMVPELISHDVERRLSEAAGDTASRFAQVLTFPRLASRIAEFTGYGPEACMDNGGRIIAMAAAARSLSSRLKAYAAVETKPEFLKELVDAVDEFKRCCITASDLSKAASQIAESNSLFSQKLSELSLLLESYDAICAQGKRDPRDLMNWVLEQLEDSDFARQHTFYIDGFPDLTRQHVAIVSHLICCAPYVTVCLNCDRVDSHAFAFEKAGHTAQELIQIARENGVEYKIVQAAGRQDALGAARDVLFEGDLQPMPHLQQHLQLIRTDSVSDSCAVAAQTAKKLVMDGCRYRDITVVCADIVNYKAPLRRAFRRCGIPLYLAGNEDVLQQGAIATVIHALDAVLEGFEQRDVLRYLRSSMSPLSLEECDRIENYAAIWNISGKRWFDTWTAHPDGLSGVWGSKAQQTLDELNMIRRNAMVPLQHLAAGLKEARDLRQQTLVLYDFLEEISFAQRLQQQAQQLEGSGDRRGQQICNQLWEILLSALEQLHDVLGNTAWDNESFTRLLRLLLSQYDVGTIPPVLDAVTAGDVSAMHCQREKHLILLGADEGLFPGYTGSSGLLTDQERVLLRSLSLPLTGGSLEGLQSEFAEIFGVFCGAEETVTLCSTEEPSFIYRRLLRLTDGAETDGADLLQDAQNSADAASMLVSQENAFAAQKLGIEAIFERIYRAKQYRFGAVQPKNIRDLYGSTLNLSASQVDRQAECRLSYFLQYGLRAKERKEATVDPAEFGTYVHSVLEHTAKEVMASGGFGSVDLQTTLDIADRHSKAYAAEHFSQLDSQRMEYLFRRNMQELTLVVEELWRELHEAKYVPSQFELHFADDGQMPPIHIPGAGLEAKLRGFVDRVDLWEHAGAQYVRVVDYKTGKKDFDYCDVFNGVGLQMLLYLFALEDGGSQIVGDVCIPAGVQYFPARVPYVPADSPNDDSWQKLRQKQWVRKGLLLHDEASLQAMDPSEKMDSLNCKRTKDGELTGDLADRGQLIQLKQYVMRILRRMVDDIGSGNVQPNPYTRGTSHDACTFCPYGNVCHVATVEGRRNYKAMTSQRFWEEIGKELERDG